MKKICKKPLLLLIFFNLMILNISHYNFSITAYGESTDMKQTIHQPSLGIPIAFLGFDESNFLNRTSIYPLITRPASIVTNPYHKITLLDKSIVHVDNFNNSPKISLAVSLKKTNGSKENPYGAYSKKTLYFQNYIFNKEKKISLQLQQTVIGDAAYTIIHNENMYNKSPSSDTHWILFQFHIEYMNGSDKEILSASDVFDNYKCFYQTGGKKKVKIIEFAAFSKLRAGKDIYDIELDKGGESDVWIGILIDSSIAYPIYRIPIQGENYLWFNTDPKAK